MSPDRRDERSWTTAMDIGSLERRPYALEFVGDRSVTTHLTWGQQWVWDALSSLSDGLHMCIDIVEPITSKIRMPPDHAARAVGALVNRFESLRTVFVGDENATMGLRQNVLTSGTVPVELWTVPRFDYDVSGLVNAEMAQHDFAIDDLPFRAVILAEHSTVRMVALRMSHMVADMWSARLLQTELRYELGLTTRNEAVLRGSRDWQPVEQAEFEASEMGRQLRDRSLQFWRNQMRRFPATLFSRANATADTPRFCEGTVSSKAAFGAIQCLSRRYGACSPAAVLMAAVMALIGAWSGTASVGLPVIVSNRHTRKLQGLIAPLTEMSAVCVDVAGRRFEEIARSTAPASLLAQRYSQYDIPSYRDLQAEMAQERQGCFEMSSYLNVRVWPSASAVPQFDRGNHRAILDLTRETSITWNDGFETYNVKLGILADVDEDAVRLTIRADTSAIPLRDVTALLGSLDPLLIAALGDEELDQSEVERIIVRNS
jgi:hypothetical protein